MSSSPPAGPPPLPRVRHPRRAELLAAVLVLAIMVAAGVVVATTVTGVDTRSNRFAPTDGYASADVWQQSGERTRASVENARLHGNAVINGFPASTISGAAPVPGTPIPDTDWWREAITPSTLQDPSPRLRLRSIASDGIRLHAQDWGHLGLAFDPAPIELPARVSIGSTWSGHGAVGTGGKVPGSYQRRSQALKPTGSTGVADGCLLVRSVTTLTGTTGKSPDHKINSDHKINWNEDETWCPGRGVVASTGSYDGTDYRLSPDTGPTEPMDSGFADPSDPVPAADWSSTPLRFDNGDDTFGASFGDFDTDSPLSMRISIDRTGILHAVAGNGSDVRNGYALQRGDVWLHGWSHPGGSITSVASIGYLTLVATDQRRLRAYDPFGRVRWTVSLPDLTSVPPVPAPGGRLVVTSLRGDVLMLDASSGRTIWKQHVTGPITIRPVADKDIVAIASTSTVTVLDAASGARRWDVDATGPVAVAVAGGTVAVLTYGTVHGYTTDSGRYRWERAYNAELHDLLTADDRLMLSGSGWLESITADGRRLWRKPGPVQAMTTTGTDVLITGAGRVTALTADGSTRQRWKASVDVVDDQQLLMSDDTLLAVGRTDDFTLAGIRIAAPGRDES